MIPCSFWHRLLMFIGPRARLTVLLFLSLALGANDQPKNSPNQIARFTDIAQKAGLTMKNVFGGLETKKYIIETTGTGVAIFDYDNDGWPDIFLVNGTILESFPAGKAPTNHLYHNNHDGTFTDVTERAGVAGSGKAWGTGCAFVDYDRDGHLDLMVANYVDFDLSTTPAPGERPSCLWKGVPVMCGPSGLPWAKNILYHNRGNGRFEDVTSKAHIDQTNGHYAFSVSTLDYDDDDWPDIFVACDSTASILYHNNRDGTFTDVAVVAGAAFNDDGTFDDKTFPAGFGLNTQYLGWGVAFLDVDNDGWPDLLLVNGHVYPEVDSQHLGSNFQEPKILYHNNGNGTFADISANAGPGVTAVSSARGLAG